MLPSASEATSPAMPISRPPAFRVPPEIGQCFQCRLAGGAGAPGDRPDGDPGVLRGEAGRAEWRPRKQRGKELELLRPLEYAVDLAHVRMERDDVDDVVEGSSRRFQRCRQLLHRVAA